MIDQVVVIDKILSNQEQGTNKYQVFSFKFEMKYIKPRLESDWSFMKIESKNCWILMF